MTAVEWLIKELNLEGYDYTIEQAKQMEKQQIIDALTYGNKSELMASQKMFAEQYYNETYGSKGSDDHSEQHLEMAEKSGKPILLYDTLKKIADFWHGSEIPKPIFKQYLSEHNLEEIATSSQTDKVANLRNMVDTSEMIKWIDEEILLNPYYADSQRLREGAHMVKVKLQQSAPPQTEISDEEIEKEADHYKEANGSYSFKMAIQWYREQLKKKQ